MRWMRTTMKHLIGGLALLVLSTAVGAKEQLIRRRELVEVDAEDWTNPNLIPDDGDFLGRDDWGNDGSTVRGKSGNGGNGSNGNKKGTRPPYSPPQSPPTKCPEIKYETCTDNPNADTCDAHTSCSTACVPKFCALPKNPLKVHGHGDSDSDRYVKLGDVCGWMDYVQGTPRHDLEVCCETESTASDPHFADCAECSACVYPQKVSPACCIDVSHEDSHRLDRAGDFGGCTNPNFPICCKRGKNKYACIGPNDVCEPDDPDPPKPPACKVFVTSTTYTGKLGGITGGNAFCQTRINAATPSYTSTRVWKAWLSTTNDSRETTYSPATDFVKACSSYELLGDGGALIATSWNDLTDGNLLNPINVDENGVVIPGPVEDTVWTGTASNGNPRSVNCDNWLSDSSLDRGRFGSLKAANSDWTSFSAPDCSAPRRIYCFEDEPDPGTGIISGTVYVKIDTDPLSALSGVTISLERPDGTPIDSTTTNDLGFYEFTGLNAGEYVVKETNLALYPIDVRDYDTVGDGDEEDEVNSPPDNLIKVSLAPGEEDIGNDFVDSPDSTPVLGSISGSVLEVGDSQLTPLVGVNVTLYSDPSGDGTLGPVVASTLTDGNGNYEFISLEAGDYVVVETDPDGFTSVRDYDTQPDGDVDEDDQTGDNKIVVSLLAGESDVGNDFFDAAIAPVLGSISGSVLQVGDSQLIPLVGVSVTLYSDPSGDGTLGTVVASTLTDGNGNYEFISLEAGDYVVVETDPDGFTSVRDYDTQPDGDVDEDDQTGDNEIVVSLSAGESDVGNDFFDAAIAPVLGSISGSVLQVGDSQLIPLVGVSVTLYIDPSSDGTLGTVVASTLTDGDGNYEFNGLEAGDYVVVETDPDGFTSVRDYDTQPDGDVDEDDQTGDNEIVVSLSAGESDVGNDFFDEPTEPPLCGTILISEIMFDPTKEQGGDFDGEWVEIFNSACEDVDLSRWFIGDFDRRGRLSPLENNGPMVLKSKEFAVIIDKNAVGQAAPVAAMEELVKNLVANGILVLKSPFTFIGNRLVDNGVDKDNNGAIDSGFDEVVIADSDGLVIDQVKFDTVECPIQQGYSLEREETLGASECRSNFGESAAPGGSPGVPNTKWVVTNCECGSKPRPVLPNVIITEVFFNPPGGEENNEPKSAEYPKEWVELLNNECGGIDLSNWRLGDTSLAGGLTPVPAGSSMVLNPGERVVLIPFLTPVPQELEGVRVFKVGTGNSLGSGLNNDNDVINIYDGDGNIVDRMNYNCKKDEGVNCPSDFAEGKTIERTDALDAESFVTSDGTPGLAINGFQNAVTGCGNTPTRK